MSANRWVVAAGAAAVVCAACSDEPPTPKPKNDGLSESGVSSQPAVVLRAAPPHFPPLAPHPLNPTTEAGFVLGRRLFYDVRLSSNGRVSCATCHDRALGFTISESLPRRGVSGHPLRRNPPSLVNLAWADTGLFWDGGAKNLESLVLAPLTHADEMAADLERVMSEIESDAQYPTLFRAAFADESMTIGNVMRALGQFQRGIVSAGARWDKRRMRGGEDVAFTAEEALGESVFERHCARCHTQGLFTDGGYHNNGLDASFDVDTEDVARGRARVTFASEDAGKFKTPTLRNVARTGPYMHDGRFATLDSVIAHYRDGMVDSLTLDPGFRRAGSAPGVTLTEEETAALRAFLTTLTDDTLASDPLYANPFDDVRPLL